MSCYRIQTTPNDLDELWEKLSFSKFTPLYSEEDKAECFLIVKDDSEDLKSLETLVPKNMITPFDLPETNWDDQWDTHCPALKKGSFKIDLSLFGSDGELELSPGGGFGDLSHPTTCLILKMMQSNITDKHIVDLGCGSGILSLAALKWGSKDVSAIDIDPLALKHTEKNADLNHFKKIQYFLPENAQLKNSNLVLLCNMIRSEQEVAWDSLEKYHSLFKTAYTSGILASDRAQYLAITKKRGWTLVKEMEIEGWLGFEFQI